MALTLGLGVLGSLAFFVSENVYAYAAMPVVGLLAAWLVPDWRRGLGGLALGIVAAFAAWGAVEVFERINSCGDSCGGLSSPGITAWFAFGLGLIGLALSVGGYLVGRLLRRVVARRSVSPAA
jgi:hypothetical protein